VDLDVPGNPLESCARFVNAPCPACGAPARRETDTMDTFVNASWFPWRHCVPADEPFDIHCEDVRARMPADVTIGGVDVLEGAFFHERFLAHALHELGWIDHTEPARSALTHEMVIRDGRKMSKSLGNTVDLDDVIARFGADSLRLAIVFMAPWHKKIDWRESKLVDCHRFLAGLFHLVERFPDALRDPAPPPRASDFVRRLHRETVEITEAFEERRLNVVVHGLMRLRRCVEEAADAARPPPPGELAEGLSRLVRLLAPLAPHLAEALWQRLGGEGFASVAAWPEVDATLLAREQRPLIAQVDGRKIGALEVPPSADAAAREALARPLAAPELGATPIVRVHHARRRKTDLVNFVTKARNPSTS